MYKLQIALLIIFISFLGFSQRGKDGDYIAASLNDQVNTYTELTVYAGISNSTLTVANNSLTGPAFSGPLEPGDLVLIYQVQGVSVDINTWPVVGWGQNNTVQQSYFDPPPLQDVRNFIEYGSINDYKTAGKYQFAEVLSVSGSNTITLTCPLKSSYNVDENSHTQVIRVPRFQNLTVPNNTQITTPQWNGTTGGVVAIEVEEDLNINGTGKISADSSGFRGGSTVDNGNIGGPEGSISNINDRGFLGSNSLSEGAEKGESIFGGFSDYDDIHSRYCYGSIANGGGGANYHNAGGGGGSNVGVGNYYGYGVVNRGTGNSYDPAWNLEDPTMIANPSAGGGRGGYSNAMKPKDPLIVGPHNSLWGGDNRRITGGVGGHPLVHSDTRVFLGGGGGAGHQNDGQGGAGGAGGGGVFLTVYGDVLGSGTISANGQNGGHAQSLTAPSPVQRKGDDGAGGAGGGGAIVIKNMNALPNTLRLEAKGGDGGNQNLVFGAFNNAIQADGPGGGGAGGMIAFFTGAPVQDVSGGESGTTNSSRVALFPVNGSTGGASGLSSQYASTYDFVTVTDTICAGETASLTAGVTGDYPPGTPYGWYDAPVGGSNVAMGALFTTPVLTTTTTYYVGTCPGTFRKPVTVIVAPQIVISGVPPTLTPETCAGNDGAITGITASGGEGSLIYDWNGDVTPTADLTGVAGGSYTLTVTDGQGCFETAGPFTVLASPGPIVDVSNMNITHENCPGLIGAITGITATGTGTLTYDWNGTSTTSTDLTGVTDGSYTLTVTDGNGCSTIVGPFTINPLPPFSIDLSGMVITDESCNGGDGSITGITTSGGTGTITYHWSTTGSTTLDLTGATSGSYTLTVTDAFGCTRISGPLDINQISAPTIDDANSVITNASCGANNGSINGITATGTGLTYAWSPSGGTAIDASNLAAGAYTLTVTDGAGCSTLAGPYTITAAPGPVLDASAVTVIDETCNGNDGGITGITVSGGTGTLTYDWNGTSSPSADLTAATGGTYTLTVTDGNGCTDVAGPYTIVASPGALIDASGIVITDETCNGNDGGIAGITVSGGATPYTYAWNGISSAGTDLTGQTGGTYTLVVTDGNSCTTSAGPFTINTAPPIVIDVSAIAITDESCTGNDGSITGITASGGTGALTHVWAPSGATTLDLTAVTNGNYTLTVTDGAGCIETSGPHTVNQIGGPTVDDANSLITDASCGLNNGSISGITAIGTGLTYAWAPSGETTLDATGLSAGTHTLSITDGAGCATTAGPYTVSAAPSPVLDASGVTITDETCNGNDGSITGITVSGGTGTLTYDWSGASSPSADLSNATGGAYSLTVTDGNGCTDGAGPFTIVASPGPAIDVSSILITDELCYANDGSITGITVTGGAAPYTYDWSGITTITSDLAAAPSGTYNLTVTDANGCSTSAGPFTINSTPSPWIDLSGASISNETCYENDGSITGVFVTDGLPPYTYSWNGNTSPGADITGVVGGDYTLVVTDANGCSTTSGPLTIDVVDPVDFDISGIQINKANCGASDGSISGITATTGTSVVYYAWSPSGATTADVTGLSPGTHTLLITDGEGCSATAGPFVVGGGPSPIADASTVVITNESCAENDGSITGVSVTSGTAPLTYRWNGVISPTADLLNATGGTYSFTVTDANGCTDTAGPFTITSPTIPSVHITTPDQIIYEGDAVNINTVFSPPGSTLIWTPADDLDCSNCPDPIATPSESTMYVVTVVSADGCTREDSIYIEVEEVCGKIQLPTVFSPNGDGLNDQFCVIGNCVFSMQFQVFNRWGEKMFETNDITECWDGTFRGEFVNTGVYIFKLTGVRTDGSKFQESGNVNLIR